MSFSCPLCCEESFCSRIELQKHLQKVVGGLSCTICSKKFGNLVELIQHLSEEECSVIEIETFQPSEYFCQMCDVQFNDIDEHIATFHQGQEIILESEDPLKNTEDQLSDEADEDSIVIKITDDEEEDCTKLPSKSKLNTLMQQNVIDKDGRLYTRKVVKIEKFWQDKEKSSNVAKLHQCSHCNIILFTSPETFKNHKCEKKTATEGSFNCDVCQTKFLTFKSLRLHKRMHEPVKSRKIESESHEMFLCTICNKTYDKQFEEVHSNSHQSSSCICTVCNRKFNSESSLKMHAKAHSNKKKFVCNYCKKAFLTEASLDEHLSTQCHKREYACQFCGRRFSRPHEKVKHERIHTGEKPHICDICGKAFRVSYCLTLHLRTHSGARPYQCQHCSKRFKSHSVYNHHMLTHSDSRNYKCPFCPKAFKTSVQLAGHKNTHTKPFSCTECNRPFASLYAVRLHMETHKRDNNLKYECWICGALYSRAFALKDHCKQHHQQNQESNDRLEEEEEIVATDSLLPKEDEIFGLQVEETESQES